MRRLNASTSSGVASVASTICMITERSDGAGHPGTPASRKPPALGTNQG
jgi:hypothetical protein